MATPSSDSLKKIKEISQKSIEILHHFHCLHCRKWWSIGDAPDSKTEWWCPWCGLKNFYPQGSSVTNK